MHSLLIVWVDLILLEILGANIRAEVAGMLSVQHFGYPSQSRVSVLNRTRPVPFTRLATKFKR